MKTLKGTVFMWCFSFPKLSSYIAFSGAEAAALASPGDLEIAVSWEKLREMGGFLKCMSKNHGFQYSTQMVNHLDDLGVYFRKPLHAGTFFCGKSEKH